jgi:hypothetical protein
MRESTMLSASELAEASRIQACCGGMRQYSVTTTKRIAKYLLLQGSYFYNGDLVTLQAKSEGLGVYTISARRVRV